MSCLGNLSLIDHRLETWRNLPAKDVDIAINRDCGLE